MHILFLLVYHLMTVPVVIVGSDSSVASLRAGRSRNRVPVGGEIFRNYPDRPGAHLASHTMGTGSPRPGRDVNHPPLSSAAVKERVVVYIYSTSVVSSKVTGRNVPL